MHFDVTGIYCINSSNPFLISPRALITPGIVVAFIPHILSTLISRCLYFEFFSYFNWSIRFSGDGHINKQAAFFLFVLDYSVWSVSLYYTNCIGIAHKIVMLSFSVTVWGSYSYYSSCVSIIHLFADVPVGVCGGFVVSDLPSKCAGEKYTVCHALPCEKAFVAQTQDGVRNLLTSIIGKVCTNVEVEPQLQPLDKDRFNLRTAVTNPEARLDFKVGSFWSRGVTAFFDVRVTHVNSKCNQRKETSIIFKKQ